jgi:hypothetical protein
MDTVALRVLSTRTLIIIPKGLSRLVMDTMCYPFGYIGGWSKNHTNTREDLLNPPAVVLRVPSTPGYLLNM